MAIGIRSVHEKLVPRDETPHAASPWQNKNTLMMSMRFDNFVKCFLSGSFVVNDFVFRLTSTSDSTDFPNHSAAARVSLFARCDRRDACAAASRAIGTR